MRALSDLKDRICRNHPGASIKQDDGSLEVALAGSTVRVTVEPEGVAVDAAGETVKCNSFDEAGNHVLDLLNAIWRKNTKPRTSQGGSSYSGGGSGDGDDLDAVSDNFYEPSDDDDD